MATPHGDEHQQALEGDKFDLLCDHVLVISRSHQPLNPSLLLHDGAVVGTYRLLRQEVALAHEGFYSQQEFNLSPLLARKPELKFLELGRSCVLPAFRKRPVIALLWQGIWDYVRRYHYDVMFGCASFDGCDPRPHLSGITFLLANYQAPAEWQVKAHATQALSLPSTPPSPSQAARQLPALIKAYLRLGSYIGSEAVVDTVFNTIDVFTILPVERISPRYFPHFGCPTEATTSGD